MVASKVFAGIRVSANDSLRTVASGYNSREMRAVVSSSSTPVTCAVGVLRR
jgi:hypothetical protein